ncbi:MAG: molecular chaperone [Stenotrophomonas maltophilia]
MSLIASRSALCAALCAALGLMTFSAPSHAGLMLGGTRLIYDGAKPNAVISLTNTADRPYAVQVWVNTAADDDSITVPFIVSPPLHRLAAKKEQLLRITRIPGELPQDRESVFYLNTQEIPSNEAADHNSLKIALRTRIKLFYRPQGLKGNPLEAPKALVWSVVQTGGQTALQVDNPTPYHITFNAIEVDAGGRKVRLSDAAMAAPLSQQRYVLDALSGTPAMKVTYSVINDYGGYSAPATLTAQPATQRGALSGR